MRERGRMVYAGMDMTDWNFNFQDGDEKFIYKAFYAVCNLVEELSECEKCPLRKLCFGRNKGESGDFWGKVTDEMKSMEERGEL